MRNKLLTVMMLIIILFGCGCGNMSHSQKQTLPPAAAPVESVKAVSAEVYNNLSFIEMLDESSGWAVSPAAVIHCENGNWADVSPKEATGVSFNKAAFLDANSGWLSISKSGAANITILRTLDGGKTWLATDIASSEPGTVPTVKTINFVDNTHGWLAVSYGAGAGSELVEVHQTTNGGETWSMIASPRLKIANAIPGGGIKTGLSFIDPQKGWLTGLWYGDTIWLYVTDDAGKTWQKQDVKAPAGYTAQAGAVETQPPMFFGNNTGILPLVSRSQGQAVIFYMSEDKGMTWKATKPLKSATKEPPIWSYANIKEGFASDHVHIFKTTDSGTSWESIKPNQDFKDITQMDFVSAQVGWAIGKSIFSKTTDGGISWSAAIK